MSNYSFHLRNLHCKMEGAWAGTGSQNSNGLTFVSYCIERGDWCFYTCKTLCEWILKVAQMYKIEGSDFWYIKPRRRIPQLLIVYVLHYRFLAQYLLLPTCDAGKGGQEQNSPPHEPNSIKERNSFLSPQVRQRKAYKTSYEFAQAMRLILSPNISWTILSKSSQP